MGHPLSENSKSPNAAAACFDSSVISPHRGVFTGRVLLEVLAVFVLGLLIMRFVYAAPDDQAAGHRGVPGNDSFYHIKMAAMIPEHGLVREFPWLRFTYFTDQGNAFVEHHYGFHVLLLPFVELSKRLTGDYLAGGRSAMMVFFGISLMLFDLLLVAGEVRWRWFWLLMYVLMPFQFFTRHVYVRAISPSLAFMLLIVLLMFRRRHFPTALAIACYIHLYLGGVLYAPLLVGTFTICSLVAPAGTRGTPHKLLLWSIAGWLAGVLTHPYSHGMWDFLQLQVFGSGLSPDIPVGREWKPYEGLWWFAQTSGPVLLVCAAAVFLRLRLGTPLNAEASMLLLTNFVFLVLTFKARRFIEYWPVFCLLSSAYLVVPLTARLAERCDRILASWGRKRAQWVCPAFAVVLAGAVLVVVYLSPQWREIRRASQCEYDLPAVRRAMEYLKNHSEPGDVVFTDDWDIFPVFFYYNSHNHYIVGLDPKFTHAREPVLWERYVKITRGEVPADVSVKVHDERGKQKTEDIQVTLDDISAHFGAKFVITDRDHTKLALKLAARKDLAELVYPSSSFVEARDAPYLIFQIRQSGNVDH